MRRNVDHTNGEPVITMLPKCSTYLKCEARHTPAFIVIVVNCHISGPELAHAVLTLDSEESLSANLLLAAHLDATQYGGFALFFAMLVVSSGVAPLGIDQILLRKNLRFDRQLRRNVATCRHARWDQRLNP